MRKLVILLMAVVLFLGTSQASEPLKFASAIAVKVCGDPIGAIVSSDKGALAFLTVEQLVSSVQLFDALKAVPAEKLGTLNIGSREICPVKT